MMNRFGIVPCRSVRSDNSDRRCLRIMLQRYLRPATNGLIKGEAHPFALIGEIRNLKGAL